MEQEKMRALSRPFSDIKTRPGRNGGSVSYIDGHSIVQRLNEAFTCDWSFRVMEHQILQGEVMVLGELRAGELVKQAFGGSEITCNRDGKVLSIADDLKSAATDSLKKAATLLGVGLHLYLPEEAAPAPPPTGPKLVQSEPEVPESDAGRLTRKQADFIAKLARERDMSKAQVEEMSRQRFGRNSAYLSVKEASEFIAVLQNAA